MGKQKITFDAFLNRAEATRHAARAITNATAPVPMLGATDTQPATTNLAFGADALALKKLAEETDARADAWLPALEKFLIAAIRSEGTDYRQLISLLLISHEMEDGKRKFLNNHPDIKDHLAKMYQDGLDFLLNDWQNALLKSLQTVLRTPNQVKPLTQQIEDELQPFEDQQHLLQMTDYACKAQEPFFTHLLPYKNQPTFSGLGQHFTETLHARWQRFVVQLKSSFFGKTDVDLTQVVDNAQQVIENERREIYSRIKAHEDRIELLNQQIDADAQSYLEGLVKECLGNPTLGVCPGLPYDYQVLKAVPSHVWAQKIVNRLSPTMILQGSGLLHWAARFNQRKLFQWLETQYHLNADLLDLHGRSATEILRLRQTSLSPAQWLAGATVDNPYCIVAIDRLEGIVHRFYTEWTHREAKYATYRDSQTTGDKRTIWRLLNKTGRVARHQARQQELNDYLAAVLSARQTFNLYALVQAVRAVLSRSQYGLNIAFSDLPRAVQAWQAQVMGGDKQLIVVPAATVVPSAVSVQVTPSLSEADYQRLMEENAALKRRAEAAETGKQVAEEDTRRTKVERQRLKERMENMRTRIIRLEAELESARAQLLRTVATHQEAGSAPGVGNDAFLTAENRRLTKKISELEVENTRLKALLRESSRATSPVSSHSQDDDTINGSEVVLRVSKVGATFYAQRRNSDSPVFFDAVLAQSVGVTGAAAGAASSSTARPALTRS